jgi:4'-phosphopantetheinyl transferase
MLVELQLGSSPPLMPREVHVWRVDLDHPPEPPDALSELLSLEERKRADRFLREVDRRRFRVGHAAARVILGGYLGLAPGRVAISARPGGKP